MMPWRVAYLSIGSNKGDTRANLSEAISRLRAQTDIRVTGISQFYKTAPQNYTDQDWFLNAALKVETCLDPELLLSRLKELERSQDSEGKAFRFGPRIIDLDIVLYEDRIHKTSDLELPHPRMHERGFVLKPMCDLDPDLIHPELNRTLKSLLEDINTQNTQEVILLEQEE